MRSFRTTSSECPRTIGFTPCLRITLIIATRLFPHGRAFAHIAAFLLPLAPVLQAKVDTVKRHTLGRNTIGMHLRLQKVRAFLTVGS